MYVLGLTGSIATGKSTVSKQLRLSFRIPVWDADQETRKLYQNKAVQNMVAAIFPGALKGGKFNFQQLRLIAFDNPENLTKLETILYPLLEKELQKFIVSQARFRQPLCVLDVPLLFEVGWDRFCQGTLSILCDERLQMQRLGRRGLREEQIQSILEKHLSIQEKAARADYLLMNNLSKSHLFLEVKKLVNYIYAHHLKNFSSL